MAKSEQQAVLVQQRIDEMQDGRLDLSGLGLLDGGVAVALGLIDDLAVVHTLDISRNGVGESGVRTIAKSLRSLVTLNISNNSIGESGASVIAEEMRSLASLHIGSSSLGESGARMIAQGLQSLTTLSIENNRIGNSGARAIAEGLPLLTSVDIGRNNIAESGARAIANGLRSLTSLSIGNNRLGDSGAQAIAERLHSLSSLDIGGNHISETGAWMIASGLPLLKLLDIGGNSIGDSGVRAIADSLSLLTALDIGYTRVGNTGSRAIAENLRMLLSLDIGRNRVGEPGARAIAEAMHSLTSLDIGRNCVGDPGACAIAEGLRSLRSLNIGFNSVSGSGAQAIGDQLQSLISLHIGFNSVGESGAQAFAEGLRSLTSLDISSNGVSVSGAQAIVEKLLDLDYLDLRGNPVGIDPESLSNVFNVRGIRAALLRLRDEEAAGTLRPLNEAKLLIVGDEAVGKTSLVSFLVRDQPCRANEPKTPGVQHERIQTTQWQPRQVGGSEHAKFTLNIWDFGGQQILHETHKWFFSERCIYLVVLEARKEDQPDAHAARWLQTVRSRAGDAPIIVVINKADPPINSKGKLDGRPRDIALNESGLRRDFPGIVEGGFIRTSCLAEYQPAKESIANLRKLIQTTLEGHPQLEQSRAPYSEAYRRIREGLEELKKKDQVIAEVDFVRLCENGPENLQVTDRAEQQLVLKTMHEMGVIIAHGLRDDAMAVEKHVTLLDPNWLTDAIYAFLNDPLIKSQNGEFSIKQLPKILDHRIYPRDRYEYILTMMDRDDLGLCIELAGRKGRYLIPEMLNSNQPDLERFMCGLRFRFEFPNGLPSGLLPRFIVETHESIIKPEYRWKTGTILSLPADGEVKPLGMGGSEVAVWIPAGERERVEISAIGPEGQRRSALAVAVHALRWVCRKSSHTEVKELVPLPDHPELVVPFRLLLNCEAKEIKRVTIEGSNGEPVEVNVRKLLSGVGAVEPPGRGEEGRGVVVNAGSGVVVQIVDQGHVLATSHALQVKQTVACKRALLQESVERKQHSEHKLPWIIIAVVSVAALVCVGFGIHYARLSRADALSEFDVWGMKVSTGNVGIGLVVVGLGVFAFVANMVLKHLRDWKIVAGSAQQD